MNYRLRLRDDDGLRAGAVLKGFHLLQEQVLGRDGVGGRGGEFVHVDHVIPDVGHDERNSARETRRKGHPG
jgi:hypothetical protein